ncbi:PLC-like phosphodiesterase [Nadsonia fulvescens var. elongata DSM 6958]|uniref:PLC-like phosphodiesterase n=1 Tax=Nadsonia fulvescens var. elongata DSM 6958 TaxID=857566 RepID=A0A1E3PFP3_9ASCO|nr:PLC-like phosphodiesterase [Nadsonia fulvescens var. elongata DSM 6958]
MSAFHTIESTPQASVSQLGLACAGHRGFRGRYPENSILSFEKAITEGHVDLIETDLRLSADNILVLSHDVNTTRCFGEKYDIRTTNYLNGLDRLVYSNTTHKMASFRDLLSLISSHGLDGRAEKVKLILDIKPDNPDKIFAAVVKELQSVNIDLLYWASRISFGVWVPEFVKQCELDAPEFPVVYIGVSRSPHLYKTSLLATSNCVKTFSLHITTLKYMVSKDKNFLINLKSKGKSVYAWTVNDKYNMKWCVDNGIDGLITDFPDHLYNLVHKKDILDHKKLSLSFRFNYFFLFPLLESLFLPVLSKASELYVYHTYLKNRNAPVELKKVK